MINWFNRKENNDFKTHEGIARVTQINDTILEINEELEALKDENNEICYRNSAQSMPVSNTVLRMRGRGDTKSYIDVQTSCRNAVINVLNEQLKNLNNEALEIMNKISKEQLSD